jgi:pimeloyl-ACP methyl ester carboxylesterase
MDEEVILQNGNVILNGTLTKPERPGRCPLVVVAHTSAAGTRDFGVYQHLAELLSPYGVAVFNYDRRGSGKSTGYFERATFTDLAADIQAAIDHLKQRSDIASEQIGLWGMSQGGWIAPLAASRSPDVTFVVAISAAGVSPAQQMDYSAEFALRENGFSEDEIGQMLEIRKFVNDYFRGKVNRFALEEKLDLYRDQAWFSLAYLDGPVPNNPTTTKWFREMDFDPLPVIEQLDVPALLFYGERDPWVPIEKSISRWKENKPKDLTVQRIQDANHFMISIAHAGIEGDQGPMADGYTKILTQWVRQQVDPK